VAALSFTVSQIQSSVVVLVESGPVGRGGKGPDAPRPLSSLQTPTADRIVGDLVADALWDDLARVVAAARGRSSVVKTP
jgi:hypothetical protein